MDHRPIDGRTKLISCIVLTLLMFTYRYYWQYLITVLLFGVGLAFFSSDERRKIFSHWKLILCLPSLNLIANLFFVNGRIIWHWGWLTLTNLDLQIFIRIALLLIFALSLVVKTTPKEMALSVGKIANTLSFKKYQGVGIPLVIIIMVAFINEFAETFVSVRSAYVLRQSRQVQRLRAAVDYIFLLQPIILVALKKADRVSDALIAKGFHREAHLFNYQAVKYHLKDYLIYLVLLIIIFANTFLVK
ncbi:energy-coupling factor transporter transmembrane component T family protein [Xylocopilactobacillus apicola]|uniref:Energy-coupling factor transporter transmembrane protein EcfT n=1 Tax=Xylocopilactobacillus apicola TaxID=2932184 RepID=A0AAU9D753_9LACO|nr:energy-coupling factor transporter transmembrane component T [Xylocopilactobacillus apicola]BDR58211.1 energy-coupling factor transporter transmembrane protein EcfT [Xylocopilactobacillus apicola]